MQILAIAPKILTSEQIEELKGKGFFVIETPDPHNVVVINEFGDGLMMFPVHYLKLFIIWAATTLNHHSLISYGLELKSQKKSKNRNHLTMEKYPIIIYLLVISFCLWALYYSFKNWPSWKSK